MYGRGPDFLRNKEELTPHWKTTNRDHLVSLLRATDMKVMNTYFQKEDKQKATYQKKDNINGGPPWTPERYGEIDLCLARRQWTNSVTNVEAVPMTNINTDHKAIHVKIKQKLKAREESEQDITLKGIKPTKEGQTKEEAISNYNEKYKQYVEEKWNQEEVDIDDIYKCVIEAAQEAFDEPMKRQKRKDCDYRLKPILEKRRKALEENDHEQFKKITKELNNKARSIKLKQFKRA